MIRFRSNSYRRRLACFAPRSLRLCARSFSRPLSSDFRPLLVALCLLCLFVADASAVWTADGKTDNPHWTVVVQPGPSTAYPVFVFDLWHFDPNIGSLLLCTEVELKCSTNNFADLHYWADSFFRTDPTATAHAFFDPNARFYFTDYSSDEEPRRTVYTTGTTSTLSEGIGVEGYVNQVIVIPDAATFQWLEKDNPDLSWAYRLRTPLDAGITNAAGRTVWQPCVPAAWLDHFPKGDNID